MENLRLAIFQWVQNRFYYGWMVLAVATVAMFASGPGQSHTFSVFIDLIANDLGISTTAIASTYAFATLIAAFGLSRIGRFIDSHGARRVLICIVIILGFSCFAFGAAQGIITLSLGFMLLRLFGQGSMMMGSSNLVAQWFEARRGIALSVMMLGFAASIAVHPSLAQWLIDQVGWRQAWVWLGIMTWILMLPLVVVLVHNKPEPFGLKPDGIARKIQGENDGTSPADITPLSGLSLSTAIRTKTFWILAFGLFTPAMLITSLFFFQVSIFEQHGLGRGLATTMFGVSALTMALAMPAFGWILDRSDPKYPFAAALVLLAITLSAITFVDDGFTAIVYAIIFGINNGANMTFFGYMWAEYFGRKHLGSIQGAGQTIGVVGASIGAIPLGIAFDIYGSYDGVLRLLAILPLVAAVFAFFLKRPAWN